MLKNKPVINFNDNNRISKFKDFSTKKMDVLYLTKIIQNVGCRRHINTGKKGVRPTQVISIS